MSDDDIIVVDPAIQLYTTTAHQQALSVYLHRRLAIYLSTCKPFNVPLEATTLQHNHYIITRLANAVDSQHLMQ